MRAATPEEQRAENYRRDRVKRRRFQADLRRKLRGSEAAAQNLKLNTRPLLPGHCGDTSYPENRK